MVVIGSNLHNRSNDSSDHCGDRLQMIPTPSFLTIIAISKRRAQLSHSGSRHKHRCFLSLSPTVKQTDCWNVETDRTGWLGFGRFNRAETGCGAAVSEPWISWATTRQVGTVRWVVKTWALTSNQLSSWPVRRSLPVGQRSSIGPPCYPPADGHYWLSLKSRPKAG